VTNPLNLKPTFVSQKDLWLTMAGVVVILVFISVISTLTLLNSGPPAKEIYVFPTNTYECVNETIDDTLQRVCVFKEPTADGVYVPPTATVTTSNIQESTIQTEVSQ
jgi:hypothetical protein